jgi:hypothetical protein
MHGGFWVCAHCGARNKGFAAVCLQCSRERRDAATLERRPAYGDRFRLTPASRVLLVAALAAGLGLATVLVRTFRGPAIEAADVLEPRPSASPPTEGAAVGAPEWPSPPDAAAPPVPGVRGGAPATVPLPAGADEATGLDMPRSYVPSRPVPLPPERSRRVYTDADLRAYAAQRGAAAVSDAGYRLALRQRRVDDLRSRIARARTTEERAALNGWLETALRDLEAER